MLIRVLIAKSGLVHVPTTSCSLLILLKKPGPLGCYLLLDHLDYEGVDLHVLRERDLVELAWGAHVVAVEVTVFELGVLLVVC